MIKAPETEQGYVTDDLLVQEVEVIETHGCDYHRRPYQHMSCSYINAAGIRCTGVSPDLEIMMKAAGMKAVPGDKIIVTIRIEKNLQKRLEENKTLIRNLMETASVFAEDAGKDLTNTDAGKQALALLGETKESWWKHLEESEKFKGLR